MEWLPYVHDAIEYIEENLLTVNSPKEVADKLHISEPVLQKGFQGITGYSVMEYVRYRRLYEASQDLFFSDIKVTDAAHKYGYDSLDGFTRAFIRFHGISPSMAKKKRGDGRKFPALSVDITLNGEAKPLFKVMRKSRHCFVGLKKEIKKENALDEIQNFWDDFYTKYRMDNENGGNGANKDIYENGIGEYGIIVDETEDGYTYMIAGRQMSSDISEEFDVLDIEEERWAVFDYSHPVTEGLAGLTSHSLEQQITESSSYEAFSNVRVEWYEGLDRTRDIDGYRSSLWIPVREKEQGNKGRQTVKKIYKWLALAGLLLTVGIGSFFAIRAVKQNSVPESYAVEESYIRYYTININGISYEQTAGTFDDETGEYLGTYEAEGLRFTENITTDKNNPDKESDMKITPEIMVRYDLDDNVEGTAGPEIVTKNVKVYEIEDVDREFAVAVYFEDADEYRVYRNPDFIPDDFETMNDAMGLEKYMTVNSVWGGGGEYPGQLVERVLWASFSHEDIPVLMTDDLPEEFLYGKADESDTDGEKSGGTEPYIPPGQKKEISDRILKLCEDKEIGKSVMEISVDYEVLGLKNHSMEVYSGGFILTNVAGYGFCIYVGEASVGMLINQLEAFLTKVNMGVCFITN